ncbi:choline transporter-like protein [Tuber borchii]|uniref:Protein PNS1 n=1 Tax=Tuber borchii TaxID=42251 RepID=A0A2T6ZL34_TUBBO|nr:choline transporter-like protein [Tuber borchii]
MVSETKAQKVGLKRPITNLNWSRYLLSHDLEGMPKEPTPLAGKRALRYSFDSIAYGSLASSIVQFLHQASSVSRENSFYEGFSRAIKFYVIEWPRNWLFKFFNHYAYSRMAFDSLGYTRSVRILRLLTEREIDMLVNNNLVDPVLTAGAVFLGYLCATLSYLHLMSTDPPHISNGKLTLIVMAVSFLIGLQVFNICLVPIKATSTPLLLRYNQRLFLG